MLENNMRIHKAADRRSVPTEQPEAPRQSNPEDAPFDPALDKKWRQDKGLPPRDYEQRDADKEHRGVEDITHNLDI